MSYLLYGVHELCPISVLPKGWILHLAEVGSGPEPHPGLTIPDDGRTPIVRIQHSWGIGGRCLPLPAEVGNWARRVASLVRNTPNCHIWIPGNEPNLTVEGAFLPSYVAECYNLAREAIHLLPGHENDQVLLPPVGPWNVDTGIGWIAYFELLISLCADVDGFALHTYSRGQDPAAVTSESKMGAPYEHLYSGFRTYRDWMAAIPSRYRDRPVYITETNANDAWLDSNTGWVQAAYHEIDDWNRTPGSQPIRALCLYRWPAHDKYHIEGKQGVIDDFLAAQTHQYKWTEGGTTMPEWKTIYLNDCEGGFYDVGGAPELTIPLRMKLHYLHGSAGNYPRPECDKKDKSLGQPEVYEGRYSAMGFYISATGRMGLVSDPIPVEIGKPVRGSVAYMHVFTGGQGGGRCGIVDGDGPFAGDSKAWPLGGTDPFNDTAIKHGSWRSNRQGGSDFLLDRSWTILTTPDIVPTKPTVRLITQFNEDIPGAFAGGHWDMFKVEQYTEAAPTPPVPGPIFEDAAALYAYAVTLRTIADGLDDVASRIDGSAIPSAARAKLEQARGLLGEVLG